MLPFAAKARSALPSRLKSPTTKDRILLGGPLVTAGGLVFIGATLDPSFRAFDVQTGKEIWKAQLPASARATPMTYRTASGKQFVVIAAGGHGHAGAKLSDALVAFAVD